MYLDCQFSEQSEKIPTVMGRKSTHFGPNGIRPRPLCNVYNQKSTKKHILSNRKKYLLLSRSSSLIFVFVLWTLRKHGEEEERELLHATKVPSHESNQGYCNYMVCVSTTRLPAHPNAAVKQSRKVIFKVHVDVICELSRNRFLIPLPINLQQNER